MRGADACRRCRHPERLRRIVGALSVFAAIHALGTIGYLMIGPASTSVVDALYMTFITVATIG